MMDSRDSSNNFKENSLQKDSKLKLNSHSKLVFPNNPTISKYLNLLETRRWVRVYSRRTLFNKVFLLIKVLNPTIMRYRQTDRMQLWHRSIAPQIMPNKLTIWYSRLRCRIKFLLLLPSINPACRSTLNYCPKLTTEWWHRITECVLHMVPLNLLKLQKL